MKKVLCSVLVAVFALSLGACAWGADYWTEHAGTESDPYVIDSIADLIALRNRFYEGTEGEGLYYELTTNLSLKNVDWGEGSTLKNTIGTNEHPFMGHFDGKGHTIENHSGPALFGTIKTASGYAVKNLTLSGNFSVAGIALSLYNASIEDCTFTGTVNAQGGAAHSGGLSGYGTSAYAGGIVYEMFSGTIKNCTLKAATVRADASSSCEGYVGGIVSKMSGGTIEDCTVDENSIITGKAKPFDSVKDNTDATYYSGGIVALLNKSDGVVNRGSVKNNTCKAQVEVFNDGRTYLGGIVGEIRDSNISVEGNTFDGDISANTNRYGTDYVVDSVNYITIGGIIGKMGVSSPTISGNRYSGVSSPTISEKSYTGATYGIGVDASGMGSDTGCTKITTGNTDTGNNGTGNNDTGNNGTGNNDTGNNDTGNTDTGNNGTGNNGTGNNGTGNKSSAPGTTVINKFSQSATKRLIVNALKDVFPSLPNGADDTFLTEITTGTATYDNDKISQSVPSGEENPIALETWTVANAGIYLREIERNADINALAGREVHIYLLKTSDVKTAGAGDVTFAATPESTGVFMDSDGQVLTELPANGDIYTAAYMNANTDYTPLITASTANGENNNNNVSSSGGGCNFGWGIFGFITLAALLKKNRN